MAIEIYARGKIEAVWKKGHKWWLRGLQAMGERHDAVLAVGHYLWYRDEEHTVAALPGVYAYIDLPIILKKVGKTILRIMPFS